MGDKHLGSSSKPGLHDYSTTAANNDTAGDVNFAESQAPSTLNNSARQVCADIRSAFEDLPFFDNGDTPTYASATTFTISGNVTSTYHAGRRIRMYGTVLSNLYGTITSSSYSAPNTTVTVSVDGGTSLTSNLSRVWLSTSTVTNSGLFKATSWTPEYTAASGTLGTINYSSDRAGTYIRLGNLVFVQCRIATDTFAVGTGTSNITITGWPFNPAAISALSVARPTNFTSISANRTYPIMAQLSTGGACLLDLLNTSTGVRGTLTCAEMTTGSNTGYHDIIITGVYSV